MPVETLLSTPWIVIALVLSLVGLVAMFIPRMPACIIAYLSMVAAYLSHYMYFTKATLIFWGIAVVLVSVNRMLLPSFIRNSRVGLGYSAGGAVVGMALGLIMYRPATVVGGAILGTLFGAIAFSRTRKGAIMQFPTIKFFNYLGAKGIPAVMAVAMVGYVISGLIVYFIGTGSY